jgi:hypothetical protein
MTAASGSWATRLQHLQGRSPCGRRPARSGLQRFHRSVLPERSWLATTAASQQLLNHHRWCEPLPPASCPACGCNGTGIGYGDYIVSVNATVREPVRHQHCPDRGQRSTSVQFGGIVIMSNGGIFAADPDGGLTLSASQSFSTTTPHNVFGGAAPPSRLNGAFQTGVGNNGNTFSNNLENGALLTINSNLTNYKADDQTISWRGYGIHRCGTGQHHECRRTAPTTTAFDIRIASRLHFHHGRRGQHLQWHLHAWRRAPSS